MTKEQIDDIVARYNRGEDTGLTDSEYDAILEEYLKNTSESNRPFLRSKQTSAVNDIVGTLTKVYGVDVPMREGQKTLKDWMRLTGLDIKRPKFIVQPKYDGCSIAFDCKSKQFFTRGDYDDGTSVNVSGLFEDYKFQDELERYLYLFDAVKFEAIMDLSDYNDLINQGYAYKTPRAAVAAILTSIKGNEFSLKHLSHKIRLMPLRLIKGDKQFVIPYGTSAQAGNNIEDTFQTIKNYINGVLLHGGPFITEQSFHIMDDIVTSDYSLYVDGCVVSAVDNNDVVTDEIAIKIIKDIKTTKLITIDFQFGKNGRITPVAIFEPIQFGEITVDHATLSTFERCVNLKHNDTVEIMYNIVPYFVMSKYDGDIPINIPTHCPKCNKKLYLGNLRSVSCTNPECCGIIIGSIIRYCQNMKMFGISEGIINKLWDHDLLTNIYSLYRLTLGSITSVPNFKDKSATNILNSIKKSSVNVPFERFLSALPFNNISEKTWKSIFTENPGLQNIILTENIDEFIISFTSRMPKGIGDITANKIIEGMRCNMKLIQSLVRDGHVSVNVVSNKASKGVICLSGTRDKEFIKYAQSLGYEITDSLSKKCMMVVIPNKTFNSSKVSKAREWNINVYTLEEAMHQI